MEGLREYILALGADLVGFADLSATPSDGRMNMPIGVSVGIALNPSVVKMIETGVPIEYFNEYQAVNEKLDSICVQVSEYIAGNGYAAVAQTIPYAQKQQELTWTANGSRVLVPHKTVAALSGLGWIGKSSLLITPQYGSAVRLTSVLTDAPLEAASASYKCLCGECGICSDACPGGAIKNVMWDIRKDRDDLIDFYACRKTVKKRGERIGQQHGTCGVCMEICPYTQRYINHAE